MNLHPKMRPLWLRAVILPALVVLMAYKALRLPRQILPRALRSIVTHWDYKMFWVLIRSGIKRAYIDQPCEFKLPVTFKPKAFVEPEFRLEDQQIKQFYESGYLGPFDGFTREEMASLRFDLLSIENTKIKNLWVLYTKRSPPGDAKIVGILEATSNHRTSCTTARGPIFCVGDPKFSIRALIRRQFNFIKLVHSW